MIEKRNNNVKFYAEGHEDNPWVFNVDFYGPLELQIDAGLGEGGKEISVDISNFTLEEL